MPELERSYGVRDGFSDETQEQALEKVSDKRSRKGRDFFVEGVIFPLHQGGSGGVFMFSIISLC